MLHELAVGKYFASLAAAGMGAGQQTTADLIIAHIFPLSRKMRFDRIGTTAMGESSFARVGVYNSDGNAKPNALLIDSGDLDLAGAGMKYADIDLTLDKGLYFIAFLCNTSTAIIDNFSHYISPIGGSDDFSLIGRWEKNYAYGDLPNPFGSPNTEMLSTEILAAGLRLAELL